MHAAPFRTNSDFQWEHFIAGSSHTPDGKWTLLYNQLIGQRIKVNSIPLQRKRRRAFRMRMALRLRLFGHFVPKYMRLMWEAELEEHDITTFGFDIAEQASRKELETIQRLMADLETQRQHAHLPLLEATGAEQEEEWYRELCFRAENYIAADIYKIPAEQIAAMRQHPRFEEIGKHLRLFRDQLHAVENQCDPALALANMPKLQLVVSDKVA